MSNHWLSGACVPQVAGTKRGYGGDQDRAACRGDRRAHKERLQGEITMKVWWKCCEDGRMLCWERVAKSEEADAVGI